MESVKKCRTCGKDLIGQERVLCKRCKEAGKDHAKKGVGILTGVTFAAVALKKLAPQVAPLLRKGIDVLRTLR